MLQELVKTTTTGSTAVEGTTIEATDAAIEGFTILMTVSILKLASVVVVTCLTQMLCLHIGYYIKLLL